MRDQWGRDDDTNPGAFGWAVIALVIWLTVGTIALFVR